MPITKIFSQSAIKKERILKKKEFEVQYNDSIKKETKYSTSVKH